MKPPKFLQRWINDAIDATGIARYAISPDELVKTNARIDTLELHHLDPEEWEDAGHDADDGTPVNEHDNIRRDVKRRFDLLNQGLQELVDFTGYNLNNDPNSNHLKARIRRLEAALHDHQTDKTGQLQTALETIRSKATTKTEEEIETLKKTAELLRKATKQFTIYKYMLQYAQDYAERIEKEMDDRKDELTKTGHWRPQTNPTHKAMYQARYLAGRIYTEISNANQTLTKIAHETEDKTDDPGQRDALKA